MQIMKENGVVTEAHLNSKEFKAFEIISQYKDLGLPPRDLLKELKLKGNNLSPSQIKSGTKAYLLSRKGAEIFEGGHHVGKGEGYWGDFTISERPTSSIRN